jgi:multidrug resistance efflux pump
VENFAGSGEFRGFDAAETTIALSQVIELGGKRLRRARVAALERDVAAWDYEATRVDVFTATTKAFVEVLSVQAKLALNEELVRLADQVLRTVGARVQAGQVTPIEETRARVALSTSRIALERAGEVITVIESRELAELKSAYLAAKERVSLAETTFRREEDLWKKKISAEQEYLEAKQALVQARIELRTAEQKLYALGLANGDLSRMPAQPDTAFTRYAMAAPFDGTVNEKHVTLGEVAKDDAAVYVIADLRSVWVNLSVYPKDLPFVRKGQEVKIVAGHGIPDAQGRISYVGPVIGETRTALARIVLPTQRGSGAQVSLSRSMSS